MVLICELLLANYQKTRKQEKASKRDELPREASMPTKMLGEGVPCKLQVACKLLKAKQCKGDE